MNRAPNARPPRPAARIAGGRLGLASAPSRCGCGSSSSWPSPSSWPGSGRRCATTGTSCRGRSAGVRPHAQAVSPDTEYFCPMDPGVVSEWPGKCGICNMALVRRKTGDAAPLPSGVVARMQFSPYRVQLAGIRTAPVTYEPLAREVTLVGHRVARRARRVVEADLFERDRPFVVEGQAVEVTAAEGRTDRRPRGEGPGSRTGGRRPAGRVPPSRSPTPTACSDRGCQSRSGSAARSPTWSRSGRCPPTRRRSARARPWRSTSAPSTPRSSRERRGPCPVDGKNDLERRPLLDNQRLGWWCPMHPEVTVGPTRPRMPRVRRDEAGAARRHLPAAGKVLTRAGVGRRGHGDADGGLRRADAGHVRRRGGRPRPSLRRRLSRSSRGWSRASSWRRPGPS